MGWAGGTGGRQRLNIAPHDGWRRLRAAWAGRQRVTGGIMTKEASTYPGVRTGRLRGCWRHGDVAA